MEQQQNIENRPAPRNPLPRWVFPGVVITLFVFCAGLFWFDEVVLNQFRTSNKNINVNYAAPKDVAAWQSEQSSSDMKKAATAGDYQRDILTLETKIKGLKGSGKPDMALADSLQQLGQCYLKLGKYAQAEPCYKEALNIYQQLGNRPSKTRQEAELGYAKVLGRLGQNERAKKLEDKED